MLTYKAVTYPLNLKYSTYLHLRRYCLGTKKLKIIRVSKTTREVSGKQRNYNITLDNISENVRDLQYAVRGPLVIRALEIQEEINKGVEKPFKTIVRTNIGDAHAMGQVPLTFVRQVLAIVTYPILLCSDAFPQDVKDRACEILHATEGMSIGSYANSSGIQMIRNHIAEYIEKRDGVKSNPNNIILSSGASGAIKGLLALFSKCVNNKPAGLMVPIPQYPLYSASITEFNLHQIGYYLNESKSWALEKTELQRAIDEAKKECNPRAIVVINPGNPTGQVLTKENIVEVIKFAHKEKLMIMADEVYQRNIYDKNSKFFSFKKVMNEMGDPYNQLELASFMSISKGLCGECGLRGGYVEYENMNPEVLAVINKHIASSLCSSTIGQVAMDCIVKPPKKGEPSHDLFEEENNTIFENLKIRANLAADTFNSLKGFKCNTVQGSMYAFPSIVLPPKAVEAAAAKKQPPDVFYCFDLLENTGICCIPGSGFGQKPGTFHFRTTILPQVEVLKDTLKRLGEYHGKFLQRYQ